VLEKLGPYRGGIVFVLIAGAFVWMLLRDLRSTNQFECSLCIEFGGRTECATGQGADRDSALQSARSVACAPLTSGPSDAFRCTAVPPVQVSCREP
jgi:hypothetical protein